MTSAPPPSAIDAPIAPPFAGESAIVPRRRWIAFRAAMELSGARFAKTGEGKLARVAVILATGGALLFAVAARASDGADEPIAYLLRGAASVALWTAGSFVALGSARDRSAPDQDDGVDALVASAGIGRGDLGMARVLGAARRAAAMFALAFGVLGVGVSALAGSATAAIARLIATALLASFGAIAGASLVLLGSACARASSTRGRTLLAGVVLGSALLAELLGAPGWSIPGALSSLLRMMISLVPGGAL